MRELEAVLWKLYKQGDPRILVLESFQSRPHTYVKVVVNNGTHDISVQRIVEYPYTYNKDKALNNAIRCTLSHAADLITERMLAPVIAELTCGLV